MVGLQAFGMFVEALPGQNGGLVHISEMDLGRVDNPGDLFKVGDLVDVICLEIQPGGKQKLSRCALMRESGGRKSSI